MKKSILKNSYKLLATVTMLSCFQSAALAKAESFTGISAQSPVNVIVFVLLIIGLLVLPAFKGSQRTNSHK